MLSIHRQFDEVTDEFAPVVVNECLSVMVKQVVVVAVVNVVVVNHQMP